MLRFINILLYSFLGLSLYLIFIHIVKTEYFEYPSKGIDEVIYEGQSKVSADLTKFEGNDYYTFQIMFSYIKSDIIVNDINVQMIKAFDNTDSVLKQIKIRAYSGMQTSEYPEFKNFSDITSTLRNLNLASNPYFAYDFEFEEKANIKPNKYIVSTNLNITENGQQKTISKRIIIYRKSRLEYIPLDAHSDISFLFVPVFVIITTVLFLIRFIYKRKQKTNA